LLFRKPEPDLDLPAFLVGQKCCAPWSWAVDLLLQQPP